MLASRIVGISDGSHKKLALAASTNNLDDARQIIDRYPDVAFEHVTALGMSITEAKIRGRFSFYHDAEHRHICAWLDMISPMSDKNMKTIAQRVWDNAPIGVVHECLVRQWPIPHQKVQQLFNSRIDDTVNTLLGLGFIPDPPTDALGKWYAGTSLYSPDHAVGGHRDMGVSVPSVDLYESAW